MRASPEKQTTDDVDCQIKRLCSVSANDHGWFCAIIQWSSYCWSPINLKEKILNLKFVPPIRCLGHHLPNTNNVGSDHIRQLWCSLLKRATGHLENQMNWAEDDRMILSVRTQDNFWVDCNWDHHLRVCKHTRGRTLNLCQMTSGK